MNIQKLNVQKRTIRTIMTMVTLAGVFACAGNAESSNLGKVDQSVDYDFEIAIERDPDCYSPHRGFVTVSSSWVIGDMLYMNTRYNSGCGDAELRLCSLDAVSESDQELKLGLYTFMPNGACGDEEESVVGVNLDALGDTARRISIRSTDLNGLVGDSNAYFSGVDVISGDALGILLQDALDEAVFISRDGEIEPLGW